MNDLGRELLVGFGTVAGSVMIHIVGLMSLVRLTKLHIDHLRTPWLQLDRLLVPLVMVVGLALLHGVEVFGYAAVYHLLHAVRTWEEAIYLSAGSYSTAGWTGEDPPQAWRVLFALESLNGILLMGWSTAFLFQNLHRILQTEENHPLPEGAIAPEADVAEPAQEPASEDSGSRSPRPSRSGNGAPSGRNSSDTELMQ